MDFGKHWYDKLWNRLEEVAEEGDERKFNELMSIRAEFGGAEDKDEIERARVAFDRWELVNS
jgi:hypothetical protein